MKHLELAKEIVARLSDAGHTAYFAGGWVRDYLMGRPSSDVDIATSATPEQVSELFPKTLHVGAAFGVVVVLLDGEQYEVASFRTEGRYIDGRKPESVEYASPEEDAQRRDFTINGLFFDPLQEKIYDFVDGQSDIEQRMVRAIGNPKERFVEDRLRMIRAVRFAERFQFEIDADTKDAIRNSAPTLFPSVSAERVWQEFQKMSAYPGFDRALGRMQQLGLLQEIFPELCDVDLHTVHERVRAFQHFPASVPTIVYLAHLFPHLTLEDLYRIGDRLRISKRDKRHLDLWLSARHLVTDGGEPVDWVRYLAKPNSELYLHTVAAGREREDAGELLRDVARRSEEFEMAIHRIQQSKPLVNAASLQELGVPAGRVMGDLLREAERIAINEDLHTKEEVLERLIRLPQWPVKSDG